MTPTDSSLDTTDPKRPTSKQGHTLELDQQQWNQAYACYPQLLLLPNWRYPTVKPTELGPIHTKEP